MISTAIGNINEAITLNLQFALKTCEITCYICTFKINTALRHICNYICTINLFNSNYCSINRSYRVCITGDNKSRCDSSFDLMCFCLCIGFFSPVNKGRITNDRYSCEDRENCNYNEQFDECKAFLCLFHDFSPCFLSPEQSIRALFNIFSEQCYFQLSGNLAPDIRDHLSTDKILCPLYNFFFPMSRLLKFLYTMMKRHLKINILKMYHSANYTKSCSFFFTLALLSLIEAQASKTRGSATNTAQMKTNAFPI